MHLCIKNAGIIYYEVNFNIGTRKKIQIIFKLIPNN